MSPAPDGVGPSSRASRRGGRPLLEGWMLAAGAGVLGLALVVGFVVVPAIGRPGTGKTKGASTSSGTSTGGRSGTASTPVATSTVVFAHMKEYGVPLHLPAAPSEMLAIGFHQSWNAKGTDMIPALKVHPKDKYESTKQALRSDLSLKLFLMMSRGRGSSEYSAADCAVVPNATILAPVTGTVTLIKTYKLTSSITDYRVEIKADGASPVRVVLIHIKNIRVKVGQRVEGGLTPVATVRHLTIDSQVNRYLPWKADHTHVQINSAGYTLNDPTT